VPSGSMTPSSDLESGLLFGNSTPSDMFQVFFPLDKSFVSGTQELIRIEASASKNNFINRLDIFIITKPLKEKVSLNGKLFISWMLNHESA
jgi:hypothetical protein